MNEADPRGEDRNTLERIREDIRADIGSMEDWPGDDLPNETDNDGSGYGNSGDSLYDDSDLFFDDVPEFDEEARQQPWEIESEEEGQSIRRARDKAAEIAGSLYLKSREDQEFALTYLADLFEHPDYSHASTFHAIKRLPSDGLDFETLKAMVELRAIWKQRTDWWRGRYSRRYRVRGLTNGETALTWIAARRVCLVRKDLPPEMMIDDDWLEEWLELPSGSPGYLSFSYYIDVKIHNFDAELLEHGFSLWRQCENDIDVFEHHTTVCSVEEVDPRWGQ